MTNEDIIEDSAIQKEKVRVWLAEYEACYSNRNHFESVYWLIASIFLVASFTSLGLSFQESIINNVSVVLFLTFLSIFLFIVLMLYNFMVQRYVDISYERIHEIEKQLRGLKLDIQLHTIINTQCRKHMGVVILSTVIVGFILFVSVRFYLLFIP
jgi:hypothetical protein